MKATIVKIGNSRGIRIPKPVLEQTGLDGEVELVVRDRMLIVRHFRQVREGWQEAFDKMSDSDGDVLLDRSLLPTSFDEEEWEW